MLSILTKRIRNKSPIERYDDLPQYVALCKSKTRQYGGGPTNLARLEMFFKERDGKPIRSAELREYLGLSQDIWKDLVKNKRFELLSADYGVERHGRGRNCVYRIADRENFSRG